MWKIKLSKRWTSESWQEGLYSIPNRIGNNCMMGNAIQIRAAYHHNGSGPQAFGGAQTWPHLEIQIGASVGEEKRLAGLAQKIAKLIEEEFPYEEETEVH